MRATTLGLLSLLGSCASDIGVSQTAKCNGQLELAENDVVDSPFDEDGDGFYQADQCAGAYDADRLDCDDKDADVNPNGTEVTCNGDDDDCNEATIDDADEDDDGYSACDDDCNDNEATVNPGEPEIECDLLDNDCDDATLDGLDQDADGYTECEDCADLAPRINPGTVETTCNDIDDDCDELTADRPDGDGDGDDFCDDCDDNDPLRFTGNEETCDDGIDQDCDGTPDNDCDYGGTWDLDQVVSYSCAFGLVNLSFDQVVVTDMNPIIKFNGGGTQPGQMVGVVTGTGDFDADKQLSGTCTETYAIVGAFSDHDNFTATFTASYAGSCYDCRNQSWDITGVR